MFLLVGVLLKADVLKCFLLIPKHSTGIGHTKTSDASL